MKKWKIVLVSALISFSVMKTNANEYRLSEKATPTEQLVTLTLDPNEDGFKGSTQISIKVDEATTYFDINALDISIDSSLLVNNTDSLKLSAEQRNHGLVRLRSEDTLKPGYYSLLIEFSGTYNRNSVGLYKTVDQGLNYLFTQFQMTDARRAFPVFDEPKFKIPFKLTISAPEGEKVFSNTREYKTESSSGWVTHYFEKTKPVPSYILALAVGPFESFDIKGLSVSGRIITTKGKLEQGRFSAEIIPEILAYIENYFGEKYPYDKADFIAVPEYAYGAMENAGLTAYREDILLLDTNNSSISAKTTTTMVLAHELAHMWYGNLVTMQWWDDLWLNEAFASWMARKAVNALKPEYEYTLSLPQTHALDADAASTSKPIKKEINSEADIHDGLALNYTKGSTLIEIIEQWVGEDKFQTGIRNYIKQYSWKNAQASDLWDSLTKASGKDVKSVLEGFTKYPGFPLISVRISGQSASVQQDRFVKKGEVVEDYVWSVPVSLKYGRGNKVAVTTALISEPLQTVSLAFEPEWIFPDNNALAYYRWKLAPDLLSELSRVAHKHLTVKERIAFIDNNEALLNAGVMTGAEYLSAMADAMTDEHPTAVGAALEGIMAVAKPFVGQENESQWADYVSETITLAISRFGLTQKDNEKANVSALRASLINHMAIEGKDAKVIKHGLSMANLYMENQSQVSPALAPTFLRIAAHYANETFYNEVIGHLNKVQDPRVRSNLLLALGSFGEAEIQRKSLDFMLKSNKVTASDMQYLLSYNRIGRERQKILQSWSLTNFDKLLEKVPPYLKSSIPLFIGASCEQATFNEIDTFFSETEDKGLGMERTMLKLEASVKSCIELKNREKESVGAYLSAYPMED